MTRTIGIKIICVATALILALASIFGVAKITTDPAFYQKSIAALEEKQETVLELTAASTAASAAITLLPGTGTVLQNAVCIGKINLGNKGIHHGFLFVGQNRIIYDLFLFFRLF